MKTPLISVIIPTRNRQKYASAAVRSILSYDSDIQIIVHDNSDNNMLREMLENVLDNPLVVYNHIDKKLAQVDNYNIAAENATGEYFCAIGDDDSILPEIVNCAVWMRDNNIDAVLPSKALSYHWTSCINGHYDAFLWIGGFNGEGAFHNPIHGLISLLKQGGQDYLSLPMPGTYHGLVKMSRMYEVKKKTGKFYGGLSPDIYSATCLSLLPNMRFVRIDYPITLPGVCPQSGSALSVAGKHIGNLEDAPHFDGLLEPYSWDVLVPKIYSVQTIWCETMIHAIKKMGREDLIDQYFDRSQLITKLYYENYEQRDFIIKCLSDDDRLLISKKRNMLNRFYDMIIHLYFYLIGKRKRIYGCQNIGQAAIEVQKYIKRFYGDGFWDNLSCPI